MSTLSGKRIVLTRHNDGNSRLAQSLLREGAEILEIPLIEVSADLDPEAAADVFGEFSGYEWMVFTSRNGVRYFMQAFLKAFSDIRSLGFIRIAAIGSGTQEALAEYHLRADLLPANATAQGLLQAFQAEQSLDNVRVLVITGNRNRPDLVEGLWQQRAIVDELSVYATRSCDISGLEAARRFRADGADALIFASASAVQAFGEQADHLSLATGARVPVLCSFGPTTSAYMRERGIPVQLEAASPCIEEMVTALRNHFAAARA